MCGKCQTCNGGCGKRMTRGFPDTMRHGQFPYEVRGTDYAVNGPHDTPSLSQPIESTNPLLNQSENGTVIREASSAALRRNLPHTVRQMPPIPYLHRFNNQIGITLVKSAQNIPLVYDTKYEGILPMDQQPKINKPLPY